ncbi:hypothetical protein FC093_10760 [Ilyomonas limi]|uniref:BON domain-containing protein n=1 Tax=Ilyomonas limi TaxID=2575867 RepID=A0A4U3L2X0_9BACT|nr:BON domain-containing protein [Ilyomonas limi]TKK68594.1 hypothetical protein FC093_10760 [Ilyomonas limi]
MKNVSFKLLLAAASLVAMSYLPACKSKTASDANADSAAAQLPDTTVMTDQPAATGGPVTISPDDSLTNNLKDATKDFPGVTATVNNGEVTLTGTISRDKLPQLLQNVNALHPKKVNNNLTIQ